MRLPCWRFAKAENTRCKVSYRVGSLYSKQIITQKESPSAPLWHDPLNDSDSTSPYKGDYLGKDFIDIDWEFIEGDMATPSIQKYLSDAAADENALNTIAICLPVTTEAISAALYLPENVYRSKNVLQILVQQSSNESIIKAITNKPIKIDDDPGMFSKLRPFGMLANCDYIGMSLEKIAAVVNYAYEQARQKDDPNLNAILLSDKTCNLTPAIELWRNIDTSGGKSIIAKRISNVCHTAIINMKKRAFGLQKNTNVLTDTKLIDQIAEVEHNRWNVEQLLIGYRAFTKEENDKYQQCKGESKKEYKRTLKAQRAHLDLRAYGELEEDSKEYDKFLSGRIPLILRVIELCDKKQ